MFQNVVTTAGLTVDTIACAATTEVSRIVLGLGGAAADRQKGERY